jgi:predicted amidophosphoribosyltransferase
MQTISEIKDGLKSFVRACAVCGTLPWRGEGKVLCAYCGEFLIKNARLTAREVRDNNGSEPMSFFAYSLWQWREHDSAVGELIRQMKGGGDNKVAGYMATLFLEKWFMSRGPLNDKIIFIPAPPRNKNEKDHARVLAESFSRQTGGEIFAGLERIQKNEQKLRDENERKTQKLNLNQAFNAHGKSVVFIDDVIVTGNTIAAAYAALGQPAKFSSWCLADRVRLC